MHTPASGFSLLLPRFLPLLLPLPLLPPPGVEAVEVQLQLGKHAPAARVRQQLLQLLRPRLKISHGSRQRGPGGIQAQRLRGGRGGEVRDALRGQPGSTGSRWMGWACP